jgi:anti-anti-sigma factor
MDIDSYVIRDVLVVRMTDGGGRLAVEDIDRFIQHVVSACGPSVRTVAINISSQSFLNSSGLGELVKIKDRLLDSNMGMVLVSPSPRVKSLVSMAGIDAFFRIVNNEDEISQVVEHE